MPIVIAPISVRCRGRNGKTKPQHPRRERDQHRVDGLVEVEPARALDVAEHPATFGDHRAAASRTSSRAARAGRPRGWRRFPSPSRRRCRRPSARARRSRRRRSSRPCGRATAAPAPSRASAAGVTRPNTACDSSSPASSSTSSGSSRASTGSSAPSRPSWAAIAATVRGSSPEITFTVTSCSAKYRSVSAASGRGTVAEHHEPGRLEVGRAAVLRRAPTPSRRAARGGPRRRAHGRGRSEEAHRRRCHRRRDRRRPSKGASRPARPGTTRPEPSKADALHFLADENGTPSRTRQSGASWKRSAIAFVGGVGRRVGGGEGREDLAEGHARRRRSARSARPRACPR